MKFKILYCFSLGSTNQPPAILGIRCRKIANKPHLSFSLWKSVYVEVPKFGYPYFKPLLAQG